MDQVATDPQPGDILEISHPDYKDWAIYVGDGDVIHLIPCSGGLPRSDIPNFFANPRGKAKAAKESLKDLAEECNYWVSNHLDHQFRPQPPSNIIASGMKLVSKAENYEFFINKREEFVNDLRYGQIRRPLSNQSPQSGDMIQISRLGHKHWAVYVGDGYVVTLLSSGEVKCQLLEGTYSVNNYLDNKYRPKPAEEIVRLAKAKVGTTQDYYKSSNGKDFAIELRYGKPPSQQSEPQEPEGQNTQKASFSNVGFAVGGCLGVGFAVARSLGVGFAVAKSLLGIP